MELELWPGPASGQRGEQVRLQDAIWQMQVRSDAIWQMQVTGELAEKGNVTIKF